MVGNQNRWRAVISQLENRNSTAGCLLVVLFFLPVLSKAFNVSLNAIAVFVVIYVSLIVPIGTGIISKKEAIGKIRTLLNGRRRNYYLIQLSYLGSWISYIYLQVEGVQTFTTQIVFNVAAEKLLCPFQRFSCLFVLLFYNFLAYILNSLKEKPWIDLYNEKSKTSLMNLTAIFVILLLGKVVAGNLALLTFSYKFINFNSTLMFIWTTFLYFCMTQYQKSEFVKRSVVGWLSNMELHCLEGLEENWVPVIMHSVTLGMSIIVFMQLIIVSDKYITIVLLGYFNLLLPVRYLLQPIWNELSEQRAIISKFPLAEWNNPQIRGEDPCAVCLDKMRFLTAKITPCGHVFHASCLRKCLNHSKQCPLCKSTLE